MSARLLFSLIGLLTLLAGSVLWVTTRPSATPAGESIGTIASGALMAAPFSDTRGVVHTLGEFQGRVLVLNFWATWCAPCREEMPGFARLQERWKSRGVQFVGLANDDALKVERFGGELAIGYPLWIGGEEVSELSRRLGNRLGMLPHTVVLDGTGRVLEMRVGPYSEQELEARLQLISPKKT